MFGLWEIVGIAAGTGFVLEKVIDSVEPLRTFCRGQTMVQASKMAIDALSGQISSAVEDGFHTAMNKSNVQV